jgi:2-polyprenyl-3-methyl-5-hydroxy-6-metoxy-1,4-benzoquinol methylase
MSEFSTKEQLTDHYDVNILSAIVNKLKFFNYKKIQYFPTNFSLLSIVKEHENIVNLFTQKKHLLFYYSLFPKFYLFLLEKKLQFCFDACFLKKYVSKIDLIEIFSENLVNKAIANNILSQKNAKFKFNISFVPYNNYILLRDTHDVYDNFGFDPKKFDDKVWLGADSIIFAKFIEKYLKNKYYNKIIEIGSGTGIIIITSSHFGKSCKAIDYNNRAVQYTKLNVEINRIKNIETSYSDLFSKVNDTFDLILANPWFISLDKGGLEEAPSIISELKNHLSKDGLCLMLLNSYIKNGNDTVYDYLKSFAQSNKYDLFLYTKGYNIETSRLKEYEKYGVDYYTSYILVIKSNGKGLIKRYEASPFRKIRDFAFIYTCRIIKKWF